ncbi:uncharacterized protein LOC141674737 [Apium graveolens]|uniref:uncharacterized protein LOC141674737 n=1 Tax=Apium graveolens TaxID=4045 RepID=UPI003D7968BE
MMLTLSAKNKIGFVNGTIPEPESNDEDFKYWERYNDLVISWLIFNLDENIVKSVLFLRTVREIWEDLEARFGYASLAQVYSLEQQLLEVNQGSDSVSEFFTKIKTLWDGLNDADPLPHCTCKLCTCHLTQRIQQKQHEHRLLQFMMKLNEHFSAVRANILMMHPIPSIHQAYRLFAQEERHKEVSQLSAQTESLAFLADKKPYNTTTYQSQRSFSGNKQFTGYRNGNIHGFPPGFTRTYKRVAAVSQIDETSSTDSEKTPIVTNNAQTISVDQYNHLMSILGQSSNSQNTNTKHALLAGNVCLLSAATHKWLIDSGATNHICPDLEMFSSYESLTNSDSFITIPNGSKVKIFVLD